MRTAPAPERLLDVLSALADGQPISVDDLASRAGVTSAQLTDWLGQLADHGVRQRRDGTLRIPGGLELLDAERIRARSVGFDGPDLPVEVVPITESTNDDVRERLAAGARPPYAVLAEAQTSGRGRRGRSWASPVASNLYVTLAEALPEGPESARGLSLAVGVAVAEGLDRVTGVDVDLKWPNDLLHGGRKLGGILVELAQGPSGTAAVIGVGLNVRVPPYVAAGIDQAWTDLSGLGAGEVSRNELAGAIVASIHQTLTHFRAHGFDALLRARWQSRDPYFDRRIVVSGEHLRLEGTERGIDDDGQLLIATDQGVERLGAGEVSIRLAAGA